MKHCSKLFETISIFYHDVATVVFFSLNANYCYVENKSTRTCSVYASVLEKAFMGFIMGTVTTKR